MCIQYIYDRLRNNLSISTSSLSISLAGAEALQIAYLLTT